ncbi:hypothetical protein DFA_00841 [Cavenderia fasciculata]|uniref:TIP41-like protein n=1 Tax=Cavenderia fasciculata TaxID=261658 RepID=F4PU46_CACFS|nr:uncharacterized protein DFA_00841 [Cavenderia fasciculata]EGG20972.1 hypothetical protein DFA_00841 [Cavenderia fasciculata]|eukprot:XP_004358822.1 hypothetical protein DFA_00841 [Cavenderia fasciculata]
MTTTSSTTTTKSSHKLIQSGIEIEGWRIATSKKPILNSAEKDQWERELTINSLPEMIFGHNFVSLSKIDGSISMVYNAYDALSLVQKTTDHSIKVSSAKFWEEVNKGFGGSIEKEYDWTYNTPYIGSILKDGHNYVNREDKPSHLFENTTEQIDVEKLKRPDPILFYDEVTLFEDELADNGISILSIKIRVMQDSVFLLQRFFLRVDDVIIRCLDTRVYHEFDKNYCLREVTFKECNYDLLKHYFEKDPTTITNTNFIVSQLPIKDVHMEKIFLQNK